MSKIVPLEDMQKYLEVDGDDAIIESLEEAAADWIEDITDRNFGASETIEIVMDGTGTRRLWIPDPVSSITKIEKRDAPDQDWETIEAADYEQDGRLLYRTDLEVWMKGERNHRVTYDHGYTLGEAPNQIQLAVKLLVAERYRTRGKEGLARERIGDYSFTRADAMSATESSGIDIMSLIQNHQGSIWTG